MGEGGRETEIETETDRGREKLRDEDRQRQIYTRTHPNYRGQLCASLLQKLIFPGLLLEQLLHRRQLAPRAVQLGLQRRHLKGHESE